MNIYFYKTNTTNPWHNLALEECLAARTRKGDVTLYLWQNERTVVIGRNQNALRECHAALLEEEGGYLARRKTGGGAVYQDLGNLCFTFLASPEVYSQERQFSVVMDACGRLGITTHLSGRNDIITEEGFKFSGNAFSHTAGCDIHHGTLMLDVNVEDMKRYLTPSREKLKAKGVKSVRSRVCNLRSLCPEVTVESACGALLESFEERYGRGRVQRLQEGDLDQAALEEHCRQYASWAWRYGKSPDCESTLRRRFDWGEVEIAFTLHQLHFQNVAVYSDMLDAALPALLEHLLTGARPDLLTDKGVQGPESAMDDLTLRADQREKVLQILDWLSRELS